MKTTIKVSLSRIYQQLHKVALERASKEVPEITIRNLAFNSNNEFLGAGTYLICATAARDKLTSKSAVIPKQQVFLKALNVYADAFIRDGLPSVNTKGAGLVKITANDLGVLHRNDVADETKSISEHYEIQNQCTYNLINTLFINEASTSTSSSTSSVMSSNMSVEVNPDVVGYALTYQIILDGYDVAIANLKKTTASKKTFFTGVLADLRNLTFKNVFGKSVQVGKVFDPDAWKEFFRRPDIDIDSITRNLKSVIQNDFHSSNPMVQVYDTTPEFYELAKHQRKISKEIFDKIKDFQQLLTVFFKKDDVAFNIFNEDKTAIPTIVAETNKALGQAHQIIDGNKISNKQVILIRDFVQRYELGSVYRKKKKDNGTDTHDKNIKPAAVPSSTVTESTVLDALMTLLFESSSTDSIDAKLHQVVTKLNGEYVSLIKSKIKNKGINITGLITIASKQDIMDFCVSHGCGSPETFNKIDDDYIALCWQKRPNTELYTMSDGRQYKPNKLLGSIGQEFITDESIRQIFTSAVGYDVGNVQKIHLDGKTAPTNISKGNYDIFSSMVGSNGRFLGYNSIKTNYTARDKSTSSYEYDKYPAVTDVYFVGVDLSKISENTNQSEAKSDSKEPTGKPDNKHPDNARPTTKRQNSTTGKSSAQNAQSNVNYEQVEQSSNGNMFIILIDNLKQKHDRASHTEMRDGNQIKMTPSRDEYRP